MIRFATCFSGIEAPTVACSPLGWRCVGAAEIEKFPCAVLAHHYPEVPNLGDVTADDFLDRMTALRPDVLIGGPPCFPAGTLILTKRGLVDIADVAVGDEVWTHKARWRFVSASRNSRLADTVLLRGHGHPSMVTTAEHPFWSVQRHSRTTRQNGRSVRLTHFDEPDWSAAEMMDGRYWATPTSIDGPQPVLPSLVTDPGAFFWLLGRWLADGWVTTYPRKQRVDSWVTRVVWCCAKGESNLLADRFAASGLSPTVSTERTTSRFTIQVRDLFDFMAPFGRGAANKTVPTWVLSAPRPLRQAFLDGYRTGDGSENGRGWKATTTSKNIAVGIRLLANSLGWSCALHYWKRPETCVIEGRTVNQRDTWQLAAMPRGQRASNFVGSDGNVYGLVRSVSRTGRTEAVFNFSVEEDESYVADGLIVHNCQDFSVAGLRAGIHGDRGNLTFRWAEIIHAARPRFAVTENVPGWLTANEGLAFGSFLAGLVGDDTPLLPPKSAGGRWTDAGMVDGPLGRAAWRILDARYFDLAQRRERVFVVYCPRNGGDPAQVLLESQSVRGNTSAGGSSGEGAAGTYEARAGGGGEQDIAHCVPARRWAANREDSDTLVAYGCNNTSGPIDVAGALNASHTASGRQDFETETFVTHTLRAEGFDASEDGTGRGVPLVTTHALSATGSSGGSVTEDGTGRGVPLVAFQDLFRGDDGRGYGRVPPMTEDAIGTLETVKQWNIATPMAVRRLTPGECAKLQGFPQIRKVVTILVCSSDLQRNAALAEIRNLRSQNSASRVSELELLRCAAPAGLPSIISLLGHDWPVAANVQINYGRGEVLIRSPERLLWSATVAGKPNSSPLLMPLGDFVRLGALTMGCLVPTAPIGLADATHRSMPPENGCTYAALCGSEIMELANDATLLKEQASRLMTSITSPVSPNSPSYDVMLQTWSCCVAGAIASSIREPIQSGCSFALNIEVETEYLDFVYRGKPAADGPKYEALGNSMAVPVIGWLGERIARQLK